MRKQYAMLVSVMVTGLFLNLYPGTFSSAMAGKDGGVREAYHLRMSGKVDQAKSLLEGLIAKDSGNAMAYYELSRLSQYRLIGGGNGNMDDDLAAIDRAPGIPMLLLFDPPDEVSHRYFSFFSPF